MLALGGPAEWQKWIASVDIIESLHPRIVVAGHKQPEADDEAKRVLDGTRAFKLASRCLRLGSPSSH
jgi:hypothetical protein